MNVNASKIFEVEKTTFFRFHCTESKADALLDIVLSSFALNCVETARFFHFFLSFVCILVELVDSFISLSRTLDAHALLDIVSIGGRV